MKIGLSHNLKFKNPEKAMVTTKACLNTMIQMKAKRYSWNNIQNTLADELLLKGLLNDEEYAAKTVSEGES